jgi:enamine deaminase RidA (YjgF/YER057c/UK114 family)
MPVTLMNPEGLFQPEVYRQVAVATGTRQVHVAGQVAYDTEGRLVAPGDLAGQVAQAYRNVAVALASAGASFADVVRLTIYVVDWSLDKMPAFSAGLQQVAEELRIAPAPASLIGVSMLYEPGILVEIEATAVIG